MQQVGAALYHPADELVAYSPPWRLLFRGVATPSGQKEPEANAMVKEQGQLSHGDGCVVAHVQDKPITKHEAERRGLGNVPGKACLHGRDHRAAHGEHGVHVGEPCIWHASARGHDGTQELLCAQHSVRWVRCHDGLGERCALQYGPHDTANGDVYRLVSTIGHTPLPSASVDCGGSAGHI